MDIKDTIVKALHENFAEFTDDQAAAVIEAIIQKGFLKEIEWSDYTKQAPRIDGRYQIFISDEQLTAEYKHPFGFVCPLDGCAFVQELITHWALLPISPKAQEQSHD